MRYASRFHREFAQDVAAATAYYDALAVHLGDRFRACVKQRLDSIRKRPESFGLVTERLRAAMVPVFPYVILYRLVGQTIFVVGLFHAAADPQRWSDREAE